MIFNYIRHTLGRKVVAPLDAIPPSGQFEILSGRCVGVVNDVYHPDWLPFHIVVETLAGETISVIVGDRVGSRGRYEFAFGLSEKLTAKELLEENILIHAENAYGHRGKLRLDGASQLNLIREHFGRPNKVLFDIDFTQKGSATQYMQSGWSRPEKSYCWTDGVLARLVIPADIVGDARHELTLTCQPFIVPSVIQSQDLVITLNGFPQRTTFEPKKLGFASFVYNSGFLAASTVADITMNLPDADQPSRLVKESKDTRKLALAFKRMAFYRLLSPADIA